MRRPSLRTLAVAALLTLGASPGPRPARPSVLPFIHDDYPRALAEARARKLPLFIDSWAPW